MTAHPLIQLVVLMDLATVALIACFVFIGGFERLNLLTRLGAISAAIGVMVQALSSLHFLVHGSVSILAPVWILKDLGIFLVACGMAHSAFRGGDR